MSTVELVFQLYNIYSQNAQSKLQCYVDAREIRGSVDRVSILKDEIILNHYESVLVNL